MFFVVVVVAGSGAGPARAVPRKDDLGAAVAPIRLIPSGSTPLSIHGLHRYFGSMDIGAAGDGLVISNHVALERYLLGLAEVPSSWPAEALKAQAVAARTYALYTLGEPPGGSAAIYGFDICASVECQVYAGADVAAGSAGARWRAAVEATEGEVILYRGRPILARYHSTSGGATLDNPQAFPDEPSYPYLQGVPSTTEEASPLYRWKTEFPLARMQASLRAAGLWGAPKGKLVEVRSRPSSVGFHYPDLVFRGSRGTAIWTAEEVRDALRDVAPRMFPADYPGPAPTSSGRLPETFPSNRIAVFTSRRIVRVIGRGWGHGVGMSQWGAHGLALRGANYLDILTHYYSGVRVDEIPDRPSLEVGLDWGLSSVTASGAFSIVDGRGKTLVEDALGVWRFDFAGAGVVSIDPPEGYGLPLRVGLARAPKRVRVGEPAYLTIALSRPARVRTLTSSSVDYDDAKARIASAGRRRIVWLAPLRPGLFHIRVEARSGRARSRSQPVTIRVSAGSAPKVTAEGDRRTGEPVRFPYLLLPAAAVILSLGGFFAWRAGRRRLDP